ncbi:MAG: TRIC cation channel family protein [Chlamydiales bacterium]
MANEVREKYGLQNLAQEVGIDSPNIVSKHSKKIIGLVAFAAILSLVGMQLGGINVLAFITQNPKTSIAIGAGILVTGLALAGISYVKGKKETYRELWYREMEEKDEQKNELTSHIKELIQLLPEDQRKEQTERLKGLEERVKLNIQKKHLPEDAKKLIDLAAKGWNSNNT